MKDAIIVLLLCSGLAAPGSAEYPPESVLGLAAALSPEGKERVLRFAVGRALHSPDVEYVSFDCFDGAYIVMWRRAQNKPLPFPWDPIYGGKGP